MGERWPGSRSWNNSETVLATAQSFAWMTFFRYLLSPRLLAGHLAEVPQPKPAYEALNSFPRARAPSARRRTTGRRRPGQAISRHETQVHFPFTTGSRNALEDEQACV